MIRDLLAFIVLVGLCVVSVGCAPRGESKSLAEIFELAKARYESAQLTGLDGNSSESLRQIGLVLKKLEENSNIEMARSSSAQIAEGLNSLILKAGYTTRPALGEIILQYRLIAEESAKSPSDAHLKLLMARTYRLLAQELETTRFQI